MTRNEAIKRWRIGAVFAVVFWLVLKYAPPPRDPLVGEPLGTFQFEPPANLLSPTVDEQVNGPDAAREPPPLKIIDPLGRDRSRLRDPLGDVGWEWPVGERWGR